MNRHRIVAAALLCLVAVAGVLSWADARSRFRHAERARRALAVPPIETSAFIVALDEAAARDLLERLLADRAAAAGVRIAISARALGSAPAGFVAAGVSGRATEPAIRTFIAGLERGRPAVRLRRWSIGRAGPDVRLEAEMVAGWTKQAAIFAAAASDPPPAVPGPPLFTPATGAAAALPSFPELIGIAGRIGVDPIAMVRLADGSTRTIGVGEAVDGWRVLAVGRDRVRFDRDGRERTVVLPTAIAGEGAAASDQ